jgi:hypothetical protein
MYSLKSKMYCKILKSSSTLSMKIFFKKWNENVIYSFRGFQNSGMRPRTFIYALPKSRNASLKFHLWSPQIKEGVCELSFMVSQNQGRYPRTFVYGLLKSGKVSLNFHLWSPKIMECVPKLLFMVSQNQGRYPETFP